MFFQGPFLLGVALQLRQLARSQQLLQLRRNPQLLKLAGSVSVYIIDVGDRSIMIFFRLLYLTLLRSRSRIILVEPEP
jgi:hypothetical protein